MVPQPTIQIASLGMADSLILMVLALVVFGPRRLPQIGRQIGKLMYEFRKASNDFKYQMEEELRNAEETDRRKKEEERLRALALTAPAQTVVVDSQVSEANPHPGDEDLSPGTPRPGAPENAPIVSAVAESPYPEEAAYRSAAAPAAEARTEESYPRIRPPSTGEPVPAAKPWNLEEELAKTSGAGVELGTGQDASSGVAASPAAAPEEPTTVVEEEVPTAHTAVSTEQASHG